MSKYKVFIFFFFFLGTARAEDFALSYRCLSGCLNAIENNRYLYDVVLFSAHNSIQQKLNQSGLSLDDYSSVHKNRHRVVDFLLKSGETSELISARNKLIDIYKKLMKDCQDKKGQESRKEGESMLPDRSLINGTNYFDIHKVLTSDDYKYKVEHAISKGLGIGMNDVDFDPKSLSYNVRVAKDGTVLLNERIIKILKEKFRLKRLSGIELTPSEQMKEKHALKPAHFIYQGTINVVDQPSECQAVPRGSAEEDYCPKGLSTFLQRTVVESGEVKEVSKRSLKIRPFFISGNLRGRTEDHTARGNLSQINSTLRLIASSICKNRNEMHEMTSRGTGFDFNIPCRDEVKFPLPAPISKY